MLINTVVRFWNWGVRTFIPYAIPGFIIVALAKAGALLQSNLFIITMIAGICVAIGLVAFNKLNESYYPHLVAAIGFALLLQTTLLSSGLVGSDIHTEYYFYYKALNGWDFTNPHPYNSAIGATVIAPFLTNIFHIPGYFIFKAIFPLLFALVPFLLYFIYEKEFGSKTAFFASVFFVVIPTWSMEMIGVPRQMLGELMLALCFFLVLVSKWCLKIRVPLLIVVGILGAMFHYITGPMIVLYLGLGTFSLLFFKRRVFPVRWLGVIVVIILLCGTSYYGLVCQGMPLTCLTTGNKIVQSLVMDMLPKSINVAGPEIVIPEYPYVEPGNATQADMEPTDTEPTHMEQMDTEPMEIEPTSEEPAGVTIDPRGIEEADEPEDNVGYIDKFSPIVRTAWGADFNDVDIWGKIFRVFQYLTQLSVIIGCVYLVVNRKQYSAEYLSFCVASVLLIGACVFIPHFASLINATRFYHLTLFLLAPAFVLGSKFIFRNFKLLTVCLLVPYFIFTSGLVFELTQQTDISKINMPYSVALSNHRVDMVGVFTKNDMAVRDWIVDNKLAEYTYVDTHTQLLLWETGYTFWRDFRAALVTGKFVAGKYIFLSERNNEDRSIVLRPVMGGSSSGRRVSYSYAELGLDKIITTGKVLYKEGGACMLEIVGGEP